MSRQSRRRRDRESPILPMRFLLSEKGEISFPADFFARDIVRGPLWAPPPSAGPRTVFHGATLESVDDAAEFLDLAELRDVDGAPLFSHHARCIDFHYELSGEPTLNLTVERDASDGGSIGIEFRNAVITDWITEPNYSATDPNYELCELQWDGERHFMLTFLSFMVILRAEVVRLGAD